jgi:hypothetical protein
MRRFPNISYVSWHPPFPTAYTARRRRRRRSSRSLLLLASNVIYLDCHVSKVSVGAMEPGLASTGCSTTTGIRRSVRSRYSSYAGSRRVSSAQSLVRSAPTASMARTCLVVPPICTVASGCSRRFSHQAGCRSSPAFEPTTTSLSPSLKYVRVTLRGLPLRRPVVVKSSTGMPVNAAPSRPPLTR